MDYKTKVRSGALYQSINKLLAKELPKLEKQIQSYLDSCHLELDIYWEYASAGRISSWRLDIDFDGYQWSSKIMKPHWMHIAMYLEEIEDKDKRSIIRLATLPIEKNNTLVLIMGNLNSSFELDENYDYEKNRRYLREVHISLTDLQNKEIISDELKLINVWLKTIYSCFKEGIDRVNPNDIELLTED